MERLGIIIIFYPSLEKSSVEKNSKKTAKKIRYVIQLLHRYLIKNQSKKYIKAKQSI